MADPFTIIGGIVMGGISALGGASSQNSARAAEQERIDRQYKYDRQLDRFNWRQTLRDYAYRTKEVGIQRANQKANLAYLNETAKRNYAYDLAIRDYDYSNQLKQYKESERIYGLQRGFNALAEVEANAAEDMRMQDIVTTMAFDQQSMLVDLLQEEGKSIARGVSGRSASKNLGATVAAYGRNQAILAESLVSANRNSAVNRRQISLDRYQADLSAESRRMLEPLKAPDPMAPLKMPKARLLNPMKPRRGPRPIKGVNTVPGASGFSVASNFLSNGLAAYQMFGGKFS